MSTIPPPTTDPTPPTATGWCRPFARSRPPRRRSVAEGPTLARVIGFIGLFVLVLGRGRHRHHAGRRAAVGVRRVGFLFAGFGLALMLYHAVTRRRAGSPPHVRRAGRRVARAGGRARRCCPARSTRPAAPRRWATTCSRGASGPGSCRCCSRCRSPATRPTRLFRNVVTLRDARRRGAVVRRGGARSGCGTRTSSPGRGWRWRFWGWGSSART